MFKTGNVNFPRRVEISQPAPGEAAQVQKVRRPVAQNSVIKKKPNNFPIYLITYITYIKKCFIAFKKQMQQTATADIFNPL